MHPEVCRVLDIAKSEYTCDSAPEFEFIDGLKAIHGVIFDNDTGPLANNYTMQLFTWAFICISMNHQCRKSDLAEFVRSPADCTARSPARPPARQPTCPPARSPAAYVCCYVVCQCPDACTLETPTDSTEWFIETELPMPMWFSFIFHGWKGVQQDHVKAHRVRCDRNLISPKYCPVHAYTEFACTSGLGHVLYMEQQKPGPERGYVAMFPYFTKHEFDFYRPCTESMLDDILKPLLQRAFPDSAVPIVPHSIRVVACIWHLRCRIEEHRVRLGGRWLGANLKAWERYARGGSEVAESFRRKGVVDPVFMFWCATDSFVAFV